MLRRLSQNKLLLWLGIIVLALVIVSFFGQRNELKQYAPFVSDSPSPSGTKALFTYLSEQGIKTSRWYHQADLLVQEKDSILLMIEPYFIPSEEEVAYYEEFMEKGNTILLFSNQPRDLFEINTSFSTEVDESEEFIYKDKSYRLVIDDMESLDPLDDDRILLANDLGVYGLERSYGEGRLVVVKSSNLLRNDNLLVEEHAEFVTDLLDDFYLAGFEVKFDEYIHEAKVVASYIRAYPFWFLVLVLQLFIVSALYLLYKGKRFGPIYTPREELVRFSDESIVALASWHMKAQRYQDSLRIQADYVKQLMYNNWSVPYHLSWEDCEEHLKQKWAIRAEDIEQFVRELSRVLQENRLNKNDYIKWSKRLDDLRKEVEAK